MQFIIPQYSYSDLIILLFLNYSMFATLKKKCSPRTREPVAPVLILIHSGSLDQYHSIRNMRFIFYELLLFSDEVESPCITSIRSPLNKK